MCVQQMGSLNQSQTPPNFKRANSTKIHFRYDERKPTMMMLQRIRPLLPLCRRSTGRPQILPLLRRGQRHRSLEQQQATTARLFSTLPSMISDPPSSSETSQKTSQILPRLGLGSYKYRQIGRDVFHDIVQLALQNKFGVLEATGGDIASAQAIADAYRSAVKADERILHRTTRLLLRVGYRGGSSSTSNGNGNSRSNNDTEREVYFGDVRQPDGAIHNISAMYVQRVLQESPLTQLCQEFPYALELIPVLHNPEVHGGGGVSTSHQTNQGANVDAQWIIHDALRDSFRGLEDWCSGYQDSQHIGGYGVVSNGLSLPNSHPLHMDVEILFNAVERATASQGRSIFNHHFQFVQLPVNLLEGMDVAHDIRERGYKVYGMRPLKAYEWQQPQQTGRGRGGGERPPVLLADYELMIQTKETNDGNNASGDGRAVWTNDNLNDLSKSYGTALKTVLSHLDGNDDEGDDTTPDADTITACRLLQSTLQDLDATTFANMDEHYNYIAQQVVPALSQIVAYDETTSQYLEHFFHEHTNLVKYQVAQTTRQLLQPTYPDLSSNNVRLQEYALQKALSSTDVTIVNCSSVAQLRDIIGIARKLDVAQQDESESSSVAEARAALSSSSPTTFNLL
jgi:hypothetical protein